jgi:hypothetical protein
MAVFYLQREKKQSISAALPVTVNFSNYGEIQVLKTELYFMNLQQYLRC